jgi:hypothetical protein
MTVEASDARPLTKGEKRYLRRFVCYLCDQRLDRGWCGAVFGRCSDEIMEERRRNCLRSYRPRNGKA